MLHAYSFYQMDKINQQKIKLKNKLIRLMKYLQFIHLDLELIMIQK